MERKNPLPILLPPALSTLLVAAIGLLIAALFYVGSAKPQPETFLDRHWDAAVRTSWDLGRIHQGRQILMANLGLCTLAILIAGMDPREKAGPRRRAFAFLLGLSALILLIASRLG